MNTSHGIDLGFVLKEKEYIYFSLYLKMKSTLSILTCLFFVYIIMLYLLYDLSFLMTIIYSAALVILLIFPLALIILVYTAKKEFRSNYSLRKKMVITFNDSGFVLDNSHNEWAYLYSVQEISKGFILFYSINTATYIPKRCFDSKKDISVFKSLLEEHLKSNKLHFKNRH